MKPAKFQGKKNSGFLYTNNEQSEKENHSKHSHIKKRTKQLGTNLSKRLETLNYKTLLEETEDTKLMEWYSMFVDRKT